MWGHNTKQGHEGGFTLVELLVTIVVVGILTGVAIVGAGAITDKGSRAACAASVDAAKAASASYHANHGAYPATFTDLTTGPNPPLALSGVTTTASTMNNGTDWSVDIGGGGGTPTAFTKTGGGAACS